MPAVDPNTGIYGERRMRRPSILREAANSYRVHLERPAPERLAELLRLAGGERRDRPEHEQSATACGVEAVDVDAGCIAAGLEEMRSAGPREDVAQLHVS